MKKVCWLFLLGVFCLVAPRPTLAGVALDQSIQLTAAVQKSPPTITLNWPAKSLGGYTVYRRVDCSGSWVQIGTVASTGTSFVDTNVSVGTRYEYAVIIGTNTSYGYILSGIECPLVDNPGKLVLLVDNTMSTPLQTELTRLTSDLIGEGWTVIRHDVSRTATPASIKAIVQADYNADSTNVKSLFLFGHVPMYFSANMNPDGHELRPWPSDQYYGDMDGTWVDGAMTETPTPLELQVGRVDLFSLPTFSPLTETDLLRRYLNKDHNFRTKQFTPQANCIVVDNLGSTYGIASNYWRNYPPFVGGSHTITGSWNDTSPPVSQPYLWAGECGFGSYTRLIAGLPLNTSGEKTVDPAVFTMLVGSYFGQWDAQDDLLRGELSTPNYGLACVYAGLPYWFVHHMALGETIGYSTRKTESNTMSNCGVDYINSQGCGGRPYGLQANLMGDPSLRAFIVAPPTSLTAATPSTGADLSWTPSTDTVLGYYVYRSSQQSGPYTRITPNYVTGTSYHDGTATVGQQYYMVRAVLLQTTPSGSYYNASEGAFASCTVLATVPSTGMTLWLKGDTGITKDGSNAVSAWVDGSGNNNGVSGSGPVFVPNAVNGQPAVMFNGGSNVLQSSGLVVGGASPPFTIFTVVSPSSTTLPQTIFWQGDGTGTGGYGAYLGSDSAIRAGWGGSASELSSGAPVVPGKWYLITTTYDSSNQSMWVNGASAGSAGKSDSNFTSGVFSVGNYGPSATQGLKGNVAEVLAYNRALTDTERITVESYLRSKYGKPSVHFTATPPGGLSPITIAFDASSSSDPDGSIVSYSWNFGDGTNGSGMTANHTYPLTGTYTITLTVTDNDGQTSATTTTIVTQGLTSVSLAGNPVSPVSVNTPATLNALPVGGILPLFEFLINDGSGWQTLRDYSSASSYVWTPNSTGNYQLQVYAKSTGSTNTYDVASPVMSYQVNPSASFTVNPSAGLVPLPVSFDASASSAGAGSISSYSWSFGDGANGSGVTVSHTYTTGGAYTATLAVTDSHGQTATFTRSIAVTPALSAVSLAGNPASPAGVGTAVTLTATPVGGYQVLYKFLVNDGSGWQVIQDYGSSIGATWTPDATGTYQLQVYAKSSQSANSYDAASPVLSYAVTTLPSSGLRMWLRADAGVSTPGGTVSGWADQSGGGNNLGQSNPIYQPTLVMGVVNGLPVVRFSGNYCALQTTRSVLGGTTAFTAFVVFKVNSLPGANYQYIWWNGTDSPSAGYGQYLTTTPRLRTSWGSATSQITLSSSPGIATWYRICARYTSGSQEGWLNGTESGTNAPSSSNLGTGFAIGNYASTAAYQGLFGDVAEIMVYNRRLSDAEMQAVDSYLVSRWWPVPPVPKDRIADVKALADGVSVSITSAKVATTASSTFSDGSCYLEEPDRTRGIKVTGATLSLWDNVTVTGAMSTDANGERVLAISSVDSRASGTTLASLGMPGKSISASGLLVTVWGKVLSKSNGSFVIDDGSGSPVAIDVGGLVSPIASLPDLNSYVGVTGLAGYATGGAPVVKPRSGADIQTFW